MSYRRSLNSPPPKRTKREVEELRQYYSPNEEERSPSYSPTMTSCSATWSRFPRVASSSQENVYLLPVSELDPRDLEDPTDILDLILSEVEYSSADQSVEAYYQLIDAFVNMADSRYIDVYTREFLELLRLNLILRDLAYKIVYAIEAEDDSLPINNLRELARNAPVELNEVLSNITRLNRAR